jgi:hypothetical protein
LPAFFIFLFSAAVSVSRLARLARVQIPRKIPPPVCRAWYRFQGGFPLLLSLYASPPPRFLPRCCCRFRCLLCIRCRRCCCSIQKKKTAFFPGRCLFTGRGVNPGRDSLTRAGK